MLICKACGERFDKTSVRGRNPFFCSERCKRGRHAAAQGCRGCGLTYTVAAGASRARRYCSDSCKTATHLASKRKAPELRTCVYCDQSFIAKQPSQRTCASAECTLARQIEWRRAAHKKHMASKPATRTQLCAWCGEKIEVSQSTPKARRYHEACKRQARRATERRKNTMRRGVAHANRIRLQELGERDYWLCQLCGGAVDRQLSGLDPQGPTVDHILPISKGGPDSWQNVQLAHRQCNNLKGNRHEQREAG